jgi:hypothetical protein
MNRRKEKRFLKEIKIVVRISSTIRSILVEAKTNPKLFLTLNNVLRVFL